MTLDLIVLARMGEALLQIQMTERVLKICVNKFIPQAGITLEMMLVQEDNTRRWTLGRFLNALREKARIDPDFDEVLRTFLEDRNNFVHNIFSIPGFILGADSDDDAAMAFVTRLSHQAAYVRNVLAAFVRLVADALGFGDDRTKPLNPTDSDDFYKILALMAIKVKTEE